MSSKMVAISARISHDDAEFISGLQIEGAVTPSDKLRAIIADVRRRSSGTGDYRSAVAVVQQLLEPVSTQSRQLELEQRMHSELVARVIEWLPDVMGLILSSSAALVDGEPNAELVNLERGLADRVFLLMESVLQMGVTRRCPCYDTAAILTRVEPILDLARVIDSTQAAQQEKQS